MLLVDFGSIIGHALRLVSFARTGSLMLKRIYSALGRFGADKAVIINEITDKKP